MTDFEFQRREGENLTLKEAVSQAIGGASTCWEHLEGTGEFQSERASAIVERLLEFIDEVVEQYIGDLQDKDKDRSNALGLVRSKVPAALEVLAAIADDKGHSGQVVKQEDRLKACDIILKYGLGY